MIAGLSPFVAWSRITSMQLESILGFNLLMDNLSFVLLISAGVVGAASLLVGWNTIKHGKERFDFINLLLISLIGMNGISMVRDLFSLYVFIEVTAIATFILMTIHKTKEAFEGVLKYLILSVVASILMLSSISFFLIISGGVSFPAIKAAINLSNPLSLIAIGLFLCGLFIKGGLVPFHAWLPDAYTAAPNAVSVLMAGIVTKASGIFTVMRLLNNAIGYNEPVKNILLIVGALSIVVGALVALGQKDIKKMLAYSSVSQVGYIIIALGAGTKLGLIAAAFHFINHAIFKSQLFANAAAIETQVGSRDMDKMGGLAQRMPITGATSAIASLSVAGIPPLAGFWSKLLIIIALFISGNYIYAVIAVLASVLTLAYFLSLQRRVFFGKITQEMAAVAEAGAGLLFPAVALSSITVALGLVFPFIIGLFVR
jgi:multicomponent Na+:H+ antiporter subunit D